MKCDRIPSSLATGNAVARWLARRHVARCLRCAEVQSQLLEITRELTDAPPLTASQQALWTSAGIESLPSKGRPVWVYGAGLLTATVAVVAIGLMMLWLPHSGGKGTRPDFVQTDPQPPATGSPEPSDRGKLADEMLAKVDRLARELTELRRAGDLLDVRRDADSLWERYAPRKPSTL